MKTLHALSRRVWGIVGGTLLLFGSSPAWPAPAGESPALIPLWKIAAPAAAIDSFELARQHYIGMSFSATPTPNTILGIFDELGSYDQSVWRLGHWQADVDSFGAYLEPSAFATVQQGRGYWLITRDSTRIRYDGTLTPADTFEIPLTRSKYRTTAKGDWNQLGNPFAFRISTSNWRVVKRDTVTPFPSASAFVETDPRVYNSVSRNYDAVSAIPVDSAFWVRAVDRDTSLAWTSWFFSRTNLPYAWADNTMSGGPSYSWVEISATGTALPMTGDDQMSPAVSIGFNFPYYGTTYSQVYVSTNGFASFDPSATATYVNTSMPGGFISSMICPFWDDLYFNGVQRAYYRYDGTRFIVEWQGVTHFGFGGPYTFELMLYPNGDIVFQYLSTTPPDNSATIGIQDQRRSAGVQVAFNETYVQDGRAVRIRPGTFTQFSMKIDSRGATRVAYQDGNNARLMYAFRDKTRWVTEVVDTDARYEKVSLALDPVDELPRIAYQSQSGGGTLKYAAKTAGGAWSLQGADPNPSTGYSASLALTSAGSPRIAYVDKSVPGGRLMYAELGASWTQDVANLPAGGEITGATSLALDASGNPHISCQVMNSGETNHRLRYDTRSGGVWTPVDVDVLNDAGYSTSIALTSAGEPRISSGSYSSTAPAGFDVRFSSRVGGTWSTETAAATGNVGAQTALALTAQNEARIVFTDQTNGSIRHTYKVGGSWFPLDIAGDGPNAGMGCAIAVGADGYSKVAYALGVGTPTPDLRMSENTRGHFRLQVANVPAPGPLAANARAKPAGADWAMVVTARQGGWASEPLTVGVGAAREGRTLDLTPVPAPPLAKILNLFSLRDLGNEHVPFVRDFRGPDTQLAWNLSVEGATGPGELSLDFTGVDVPAGMRFQLSDPAAGWSREVHGGETVTIAATGTRELSLVADASGVAPTVLPGVDGIRFAYPNPFSDRIGLVFTLAKPGNVAVDVFDIAGRRVAGLERHGAEPGEQVLIWDGRDSRGRALPNGIYLARYRAGSASGVRRLVKVR